MKSILVTGVSTGIGHAITSALLAGGYKVYGSVRTNSDAERCAGEFGPQFSPLVFDVTDEQAVRQAADFVRNDLGGQKLNGLVNNAGIAVPGPLLLLAIDEFRSQMEVNVTGQLIVTQAFAPLLGADRSLAGAPGKIVNISSVAGKMSNPFVGAYSASKHALEALSVSLRRELLIYGIDVVVVGPGAIRTPIWDKAERQDLSQYETSDYGPFLEKVRSFMVRQGAKGLDPSAIGNCVRSIFDSPSPRARYAVVPSKFSNWIIPRLLPQRVLDRIIAKRLGLNSSR
jgi:NAD(P)-dependent dehydrogenase (short-subunit alcohol dehydrogenase family)